MRDKRVFHTLDGLRGVAAIAVAVRHSHALFGWLAFPNSQLAVDLFFVLSGFVLAHSYGQKLKGAMTTWTFMKIRVIRLFPLYLLGFVLGAVVVGAALMVGHAGLGDHKALDVTKEGLIWAALLGLLLLPVPSGVSSALYPLNDPSWSLLLELISNLVWAFVLHWLPSRALRWAAFAILAASSVGLVFAGLSGADLGGGFEWSTFGIGLARLGFSFTAGLLLYNLRPFRVRVPPLLLLAVLIVAFLINPPGRLGVAYQLACVFVGFPLLVWAAAANEPGPRLVRPFRILGVTSYAVYMLHKPAEELIVGLAAKFGHLDTLSIAPWGGIAFVAVFLGATWWIDKLYDKPVRDWLTKRSKGRPPSAPLGEPQRAPSV